MAVTMAGLEIEKTSGYWRAKGFKTARRAGATGT